jgi:hypothetical protein
MRRRLNLLAMAVVAVGGTVLARPAPLAATYLDPKALLQSCCVAIGPFGGPIYRCCSYTGCVITAAGCSKL